MRRVSFGIVYLALSNLCFSQQFSFQIHFEDAIGNLDSLTIGFDPLATDSIDAFFGEENIIAQPIDSAFDVRITNEWINRTYYSQEGTFHTKTQIGYYNCGAWTGEPFAIDIHTDHWPVTAYWDSTLFTDECNLESVLTSMTPAGWFDTGSISDLGVAWYSNQSSVTFTSNVQEWYSELLAYIDNDSDSIPVFWTAIGGDGIAPNINNYDPTELTLFPNPTSDIVRFDMSNQAKAIVDIKVFNSLGAPLQLRWNQNILDFSSVSTGIYWLLIMLEDGNHITTRVVRN